jgi:hypothetical protein
MLWRESPIPPRPFPLWVKGSEETRARGYSFQQPEKDMIATNFRKHPDAQMVQMELELSGTCGAD